MKNKEWISYWKKNLADTLKSHIDIDIQSHFEVKDFDIKQEYIDATHKINELIDIEEIRINKKAGIKILKNNIWVSIKETHVLIAPMVIKEKEPGFTTSNDSNPEIPFWYFAKVDRRGNLSIPTETFPIFQPELQKYLPDENIDFSLEKLEGSNKGSTSNKIEFKDYAHYIHYMENLYKETTGQEIGNINNLYHLINKSIILLPHQDILLLLELINFIENIKP
jgi:hypothetical protein